MRRPAGASPRRKRTHDHFRVRQAMQTDARGHFGHLKCVAPAGDALSSENASPNAMRRSGHFIREAFFLLLLPF
jgi:hypothetical protein